MKIAFKKWDIGGKIIFISACVALFSFLLPWVDIGLVARNAFSQFTFILGAVFIYPLLSLLKSKSSKKWIGIVSGVLAIGLTVLYIYSKQIEWINGQTLYVAGSGAYLFVLTLISFIVGVLLHKKK
jgi:hypothetical protein